MQFVKPRVENVKNLAVRLFVFGGVLVTLPLKLPQFTVKNQKSNMYEKSISVCKCDISC